MRVAVPVLCAVLVVTPRAAATQIAPPSGRAPPDPPPPAQSCASCHGPGGGGDTSGNVPRIAGLSSYYTERQLRSYAEGTRQNPPMESIARSLSPREIVVVAAYFARLDTPAVRASTPAAPPGAVERGRQLATTGSRELRVQACDNCHGPGGTGQPPAIPFLAGQSAAYLVSTLNAWRAGTRDNDSGQQMGAIARALSPEAIAEVTRYYSDLAAPPPSAFDPVRPPPFVSGGASDGAATVAATGRSPAAAPEIGDPARGRAILASGVHGCAACHNIPGIRRANGVVGPSLDGLARRAFIAGQLPNRPETLVAFLLDPPALVPRTGMPDTGLTREEAIHVAAYLSTLKR